MVLRSGDKIWEVTEGQLHTKTPEVWIFITCPNLMAKGMGCGGKGVRASCGNKSSPVAIYVGALTATSWSILQQKIKFCTPNLWGFSAKSTIFPQP